MLSANAREPARSRPGVLPRLSALWLGEHAGRRFALRQMRVVSGAYAGCVGLALLAISLGVMDRFIGHILIGYMIASQFVFYGLVRSGWSLRFEDLGLIMAQSISSIAAILLSYAVCADGLRPVTLLLLPLVLVHSMFFSAPRQATAICVIAVAATACVSVAMNWFMPQRFDLVRAWFAVGMVAISMPALTMVAWRVIAMRRKLLRQKVALIAAVTRVEELATRDELTGLLNRRHMLHVLEENLALSQRNGRAFGVAMVDIDHFKRINDTWGHAVGDAALRTFAQHIRSSLREIDVVARWGGEEFLVLMPEAASSNPGAGLERLRARLRTLRLSDAAPDLRLPFSAGIAIHETGDTVERILERADRALYAAKAGGRQRTVNSQMGSLDTSFR